MCLFISLRSVFFLEAEFCKQSKAKQSRAEQEVQARWLVLPACIFNVCTAQLRMGRGLHVQGLYGGPKIG